MYKETFPSLDLWMKIKSRVVHGWCGTGGHYWGWSCWYFQRRRRQHVLWWNTGHHCSQLGGTHLIGTRGFFPPNSPFAASLVSLYHYGQQRAHHTGNESHHETSVARPQWELSSPVQGFKIGDEVIPVDVENGVGAA